MESPLALYRRYRPETFAEVIGQDHVTTPLRAALASCHIFEAYPGSQVKSIMTTDGVRQ